MRILPVAAAALVALTTFSPASATELMKKNKKVRPIAPVSRIDDIYGRSRADLLVGPAVDPGSDNRYFSDTRYPHYLVGPGFNQRYNDNTFN